MRTTTPASRTGTAATLTVENLSVHYGGVCAVRSIGFSVEPGASVGIIGANGAGKTSTLKALMGLVPRSGGQLGAGGAGAAVAHALLTHGTAHLIVVDPLTDRAVALVGSLNRRFGEGRATVSTLDGLPALLPRADGLVHATPTGTPAHPGLPLPADLLHPGLWVVDIVYRPLETELLRVARPWLRRAQRCRHGRVPGRRRVPALHRARTGPRAHARPCRRADRAGLKDGVPLRCVVQVPMLDEQLGRLASRQGDARGLFS